jgi:hypothetical protein
MVPRASGPVFMLCALRRVFGGNEGDGFRLHVMRARTRFQRYRVHRVTFSCYAHPNSFWAVARASGPVFMFCAPGLIFVGTEGNGACFLILRAQTHFQRYRGRRVPFSCFARADSFSTVPRASDPVLMFCPPGLIFGGTEGVRSRFHVLRARTRFRRYRGCRVPFSCFASPDSFSGVTRVSGPVFLFCALGLVFGDIEVVGSCFHVMRTRTRFRR